jgi:hypothetical protein
MLFMRKYLILLTILNSFNLKGQEVITDDSIILKRGIYKDFYEFKYNKPSIPLSYKIISSESSYGLLNLEGKHKYFTLDISKKQGDSIGVVFGFCDGHIVYINPSNPSNIKPSRNKLSSFTNFEIVELANRFCYFKALVTRLTQNSSYETLNNCFVDLNINQDDLLFICKSEIKSYLENEPLLLDSFKNDANRELKLKYYLHAFQSHLVNRVKRDSFEYSAFDINEILQNHTLDTANYYNDIINKLKKCRNIYKIEIYKSNYNNGKCKSIGLRVSHSYDLNATEGYPYKIGYWMHFYKDGKIKEEVMYNLFEKKIFDKNYDSNGQLK